MGAAGGNRTHTPEPTFHLLFPAVISFVPTGNSVHTAHAEVVADAGEKLLLTAPKRASAITQFFAASLVGLILPPPQRSSCIFPFDLRMPWAITLTLGALKTVFFVLTQLLFRFKFSAAIRAAACVRIMPRFFIFVHDLSPF